MSKGRILVVDDDFDIANMLRIYFSGQGYAVEVSPKGADAIAATRKQLPNLIVLDVNLPDMNGFDVCVQLRSEMRTRTIPIIFLTQRDERSDKLIGLESGADDYVTKPFDIEELKLRVANSIVKAGRIAMIDPRSNLPMGPLIEEHLRGLMRADRDWTYVDIKIANFEPFADVYGWTAGDEVIRAASLMIGDLVKLYGTDDDYIGHAGRDNFVIITHANDTKPLIERLIERFDKDIKQHYSFIDRERGYMLVPSGSANEKQVELMTLAIGAVSTRTHQFSDIREVTELAAEDRRRSRDGDSGFDTSSNSLLTSW